MLTSQEMKLVMHCKEIELEMQDIASILVVFRTKTLKEQKEILEEVTRMNDLMEVMSLLVD